MEPYFEKYFFIEEMVVAPSLLGKQLFANLESQLALKYPKTYQDKGYIFNIKVDKILDNRITLCGQIILKVKFGIDLYVPKVGHVFQSKVMYSNATKHSWIEVWSGSNIPKEEKNYMTIFLDLENDCKEGDIISVKITNVKPDYTLCFGKQISFLHFGKA